MSQLTRGQINDLVAGFACRNPEYRRALRADPKRVLSRQLGKTIPSSLDVELIEETADTVVLVLPYRPREGDELSDADLEIVSGGKGDSGDGSETFSCQVYGAGQLGTLKEINADVEVF
jgi:hypothetical protein